LTESLSTSSDLWWLLPDLTWAGPGRWLRQVALPMRGPVAAGGDPVPVAELPAGARTLEYWGMITPGLQDAHVHSGLIDLPGLRAGGISAALDLGGVPEQVGTLRLESLDPASDLPALQIAGAFLTAPGGYPSDRSWAAPGSWREVHSAGDAEAAVGEQLAVGADVIKVALNAEAGPVPSPAVLAAIVSAAQSAGRPVVAHAEGPGTVPLALTAGVNALAHIPWTENLPADLLRACAEQTAWISTTHIHGRGPALTVALDNLVGFMEHGGRLRYGTDLGNGRRRMEVDAQETLMMETIGMNLDEVLASMTGSMLGEPYPGGWADPDGNGIRVQTGGPSRFLAGIAPAQFSNEMAPHERVVGPMLRQAEVFSIKDIVEMERMEKMEQQWREERQERELQERDRRQGSSE
jgi:hypothetical protein